MNHSPGPWKMVHNVVTDADDNTICVVHGDRGPADAFLIAAAPELLAELQDLVETAPLTHERHERISEAIAKATGAVESSLSRN